MHDKSPVKRRRDSQRSRVYDWEWKIPGRGGPDLALSEAQALVIDAWHDEIRCPCVSDVWSEDVPEYRSDFGFSYEKPRWARSGRPKPPKVTNGRGARSARYIPAEHRIALPRGLRGRNVVLHELSHALIGYHEIQFTDQGELSRGSAKTGYLFADHGPEFVEWYLRLLEKYAGIDRDAAVQAAKAMRVRIAPTDWRDHYLDKWAEDDYDYGDL